MIPKTGKLYINGLLNKNRYDKNEDYGFNGKCVTFWEILIELFCCGHKITISRIKTIIPQDVQSVAFDPSPRICKCSENTVVIDGVCSMCGNEAKEEA